MRWLTDVDRTADTDLDRGFHGKLPEDMPDTGTRERFAERLQRAPLLSDGAMGTELYQRGGMPYGRCLDELNLTSPDLVKSVHLDYIRAGAELIETNTFGANRVRLAAHGLGARMDEINQAGVRLAREAQDLTGQRVWIAGAVGPLGDPLAPLGPIGLAQVRRRLGGFPVPVLLGILPLRSRRHAEFLHNEVPGINVTDEVMYKMSSAGKRAPEVGIELCRELLRDVSGVVARAYFMPPFGRYETVLEVLDGIELVGP